MNKDAVPVNKIIKNPVPYNSDEKIKDKEAVHISNLKCKLLSALYCL